MPLINRFSALVAVVAVTNVPSGASAALVFRASMFRPAAAPTFREGRVHHARVIPTHPPQNNYRGPPLPLPCPPGQVWGYWPAIQGWMCSPPGHVIGPR